MTTIAVPTGRFAEAELILAPGADRTQWLATRRAGLGGSEVSTLVGLTRYESPYELWLDKTGQVPLVDDAPSEAAEMGTLLEPVVRDRFAAVHGLTVDVIGTYRSQEWPWMIANPDGLCSDGAGYEGKTCSQWLAHQWKDGQTADHAELQAQWGMAVTGLPAWHVAVLIGGQHNEYRLVERDDELIAVLVDVSRRFWHDHVLTGQPPAWGGSDAAIRYLTDRYPTAGADTIADIDVDERDEIARLREKSVAAEKAALADSEALKNRVRALIGDAEQLMCGDAIVATWRNTGQFSEKRFREQQPDLAARYTRPVTADQLDTAALAADHPDLYRRCRARRLDFKI
jgi:putative phage-type endonuclease